METLSAALRNPVRWTLDGALFAALLIVAVTGVAVERSIAYTVDAVTTPNTANSVVYGNWIETQFDPSATVSGSASTGVTWSASNLPPNTAAEFRFDDDNTSSTPTPTLVIEQVDGTRGPDAASYTITVTATGSDASVETGTLTLVVEPRPVRIEGSFSVQNKTYDASTDANITSTSLSLTASDGLDSGILTGDDLELVEVATFSSADVGLRTATLGSSSLGGADAVNYELDLVSDPDDGYTVPTASATISAKSLELDPSSLTFSKTYDGLTTITPSGNPAVESEGLEGSDSAPTVSGSPTWSLDNANVGTSKTVTITSGAYSLSDGNYTLSSPTFTTATVTKATLTVNFSTSSRAYNGSKDVTADTTITGYSGRATADSDVTASFTAATLASASVGTHAVTLSGLSLSSAQAEANYTVVAQTGPTGQITKKTLTIGGTLSTTAGEYDKVYDGTRVASGDTSGLSLVGVEVADSVSIASVTLQFAQADTGTAIVVSVSAASLGGDDQGNYQISASGAPSATGDITAFEFTINDTLTATATAKTYDGNADANVTCTLSTFADGLGVAADCSNATFDNGGAVVLDGSTPQAHAISITSITLSNNSAGNYALPGDSMTTTGVINPKQLTISGLSGVDRTYNGGVDASVTGTETLVGVVGADNVTLTTSGRSFEFANKNVGSNKAITASGYEISGPATSNYTLTQPTGLTANITAKSVTVSATHDGRVYNSTTHVDSDNLTLTVNGVESDDAVTVSYEEALFNSEDASQDASDFRTVSVTGISLGGADASNYSLSLTTASDTEVIIDKRPLSIGPPSYTYSGSATGTAAFDLESREWDSTDETELVFVCNDERTNCPSDDVDVTVSGSFAEIYVHTGPFTFDDPISVTGSDATNYTYTLPTSGVEGSINRRTIGVGGLTVSSGKTYDGNDSASSVISGTPTISSTLAQNDGVTLITGSEVYTFETQYVGSDLDIATTGFALSKTDVDGDGTNEFVIDQPSFLADITVREVTITGTFTANDRVYNTNTTATIDNNSLTLDGIQSPDTVTLNTPTIAFASANANESTPTTVTITAATLSATDMNDDGEAEYSLSLVDAPETTATISRYDLDSTLRATVANKTYDSTTTATVTSVSVTDLAGDDVTVASGYTGVFVSEAVGTDIDVNLSGLTLQGTAKDNYTLSSTATIENAADITGAALQVGGIPTPSNKTYDGTNDTFFGTGGSLVDDSAATLTGVADDDTVTLDKSGADFVFTNVNQGLRTIQGSGYALSGTHAANYTLTQPTLSATIERKVLTVSANTDAASNTRVYDTTDNARSITTLVLSAIVSGDESDVEATATSITFDDPDGDERAKDVGANKSITASGVELATPTGGSSTVTGNYSLGGVTSVQTSASITKRPLTLTPSPLNTVSDNSSRYEKIYDGQAQAEYDDGSGTVEMVTCSVNSLSGDTVSADCTDASFADENVARDGSDEVIDKDITVQNISLSGTDASNYSLASTTLTLTEAAINPKPLVASGFEPNDKVYDGERSATFSINSASLSGFVGSDNFAFDSLTGVFFSRDVAVSGGSVIDQNVRLTSWRFNGTDGVTDNYTIDIDNSITQGKITPKDLPVVLTATSRPYNANTTVTLSAEVDTDALEDRDLPQGGDAFVDATATGAFPEKNVGTHTITSLSVSLTGGDAGDRSDNYVPVFSGPSATITARTLTWTVNASDKTYDGTDDAGLSLSDISDNRLSGDVFTVTFSSDTFDSANAGVGKTVTVSGLSISGTDAGNYSYATSATDTATISQRQVSVAGTFTSDAKEYDRNTAATLTDTSSLSLSNLVAADQPGISIASTTAQFDTNAVGQNKTVQLTGLTLLGTNSANYSVDVSGVTDYTEGEITPKTLTPTITVQDRLWDGTTNATVTSITLAGVISGDSVSIDTASAVGAFRDADQGSAKTVDVTNIRFKQTGAWANYVLDLNETAPGVYSSTATASITGSPLTISIVASDKTYDGTTAATVTVTFTAADNSTVVPTYSGGTATFSQSDVGTNLLVTASGFTLTGVDADKYVLSNTSATDRADITAITLGITAEDKMYDGTDRATVDLDGVLSGEDVGFASAPTATFDDPVGDARGKDVGVNKAVTATGISLTGDDSGNYTIGGTETAAASISQRLLTPVFTPNPAVTQATSPVTVDVTDDRITNDVLTVDYTLAETIRRGNQLVLVVTNITLSDTDGDNYRVVSPYELVLQTFATPTRERDDDIAPLVETAPAPQVAPRAAPRPTVPPATSVERPVAPSTAPADPVAEQPGTQSPDILPGWRPPVSSRATIDFGQGILERTSRPRDIADQIRVEPPSILLTDRFDGFEPQAPVQLEIMGAKTVTSIRVTAEDAGNPERLRALLADALRQSPNQPGLPATTGPQIVSVSPDMASRVPSPAKREVLEDALAWLGLPPLATGPGVSDGAPVAQLLWEVEGFRPGSSVFLVVTSDPGLVAWGTANDDGVAVLQGTLQADSLIDGEHRLRIIGTSVFEGGLADDTGAVVFTEELTALTTGYDRDTRISVALWGANPEGADHVAVRYIDPELAGNNSLWWWLLLLPILWVLIVLWRRRQGDWTSPTGRVGTASAGAILATPAIAAGVVFAQDLLIPAGIAVAVLAALLAATIPARANSDENATRRRPRTS